MSEFPPLRDYRSADFEAIWQLDQICFSPEIAYSRAELRLFLDRPGTFTLVAEEAGQVSGFILTHVLESRGHIITIDVRDIFRRTGLGSRLLCASEVRLRSMEIPKVALEVAVDNLPAITFYKRHGYTMVKTVPRYYANGVDALRMSKLL